MELILNVGDKITAEVEKRDRAGRLKRERLRFLIIKNFSNKAVAITDEFKDDDSDVIFRSFDLNELFNIKTEANEVKIKVED